MAKQNSGESEPEEEVKGEVEAEVKVQTEVAFVKGDKAEAEPKFTKEQLLNSKKYTGSKDILTALLTEGESYTHAEVGRLTEGFMKGEIK